MKRFALVLMVFATTTAFTCDGKPKADPNAPKTPEWEACIDEVAAYADCTAGEADGLDEGTKGRIQRQMETKKNQSLVSEERCEKVISAVPADDPCGPK